MIHERIAQGVYVKDIAAEMGVHPRTVSRALTCPMLKEKTVSILEPSDNRCMLRRKLLPLGAALAAFLLSPGMPRAARAEQPPLPATPIRRLSKTRPR